LRLVLGTCRGGCGQLQGVGMIILFQNVPGAFCLLVCVMQCTATLLKKARGGGENGREHSCLHHGRRGETSLPSLTTGMSFVRIKLGPVRPQHRVHCECPGLTNPNSYLWDGIEYRRPTLVHSLLLGLCYPPPRGPAPRCFKGCWLEQPGTQNWLRLGAVQIPPGHRWGQ